MKIFDLLKSINEVEQASLFVDDDQKPEHKFLVTPMGIGYNDLEHAKSVADKNAEKKAKVIDTASGECVYKGKS